MRIKDKKKFILTGYRAKGIKLYIPKRNKIKVGLLFGFVVLCVVTPFTNWLIAFIGIGLNKYPLWIYK